MGYFGPAFVSPYFGAEFFTVAPSAPTTLTSADIGAIAAAVAAALLVTPSNKILTNVAGQTQASNLFTDYAKPGDAMALTTGERSTLYTGLWNFGTRTMTGFGTLVSDVATAVQTALASAFASITAKTNNLPSDPADASDIASAFGTVNATLATVLGKTNLIPAVPASQGDVTSAVTSVNAHTDSALSGFDAGGGGLTDEEHDLLVATNARVLSMGSVPVVNVNPLGTGGTLTLIKGRAYKPEYGNNPNPWRSNAWVDLTPATLYFSVVGKTPVGSVSRFVDDDDQLLVLSLDDLDTLTMGRGEQKYCLYAIFPDSPTPDPVELVRGTLIVV